jgi:hypothetical protein
MSSNYLFENALRLARQHDPNFQPGKILQQKRRTSRAMTLFRPRKVVLKVGPLPAAPAYTRMGVLKKRQPKPHVKGDILYAKLWADGCINLYPFELAGSGYEIIKDAVEGVHYEFV